MGRWNLARARRRIVRRCGRGSHGACGSDAVELRGECMWTARRRGTRPQRRTIHGTIRFGRAECPRRPRGARVAAECAVAAQGGASRPSDARFKFDRRSGAGISPHSVVG